MNKRPLIDVILSWIFLALTILSARPQGVPNSVSSSSNLNSKSQALLEVQLSNLVKQVVSAAADGKGEVVKDAITQQYLKTGEQIIKTYKPGSNLDKALVSDFNYYAITGIDKVIIDKDVAFVEARIAYHPDKLAQITQDEKDAAANASTPDGNLWSDMGGDASADQCEKHGAGLATYYLVAQKGVWKIHSTYFSLNPLTPSELDTVRQSMKTLVQ